MSDDSKQTPRTDGAAILRDFERLSEEARKGSLFVSLPGDERVYVCEDAYAAATLTHGWRQSQPPETPPAARPGNGPSSE